MTEQTALSIDQRPSGVILMTVDGDLDSLGTHHIEPSFSSAIPDRSSRVVVDMAGVSFISSAGMAMLLVKGKMLRQGGGTLVIANANERVVEVLGMAGFNELFDIYASTDDALTALE